MRAAEGVADHEQLAQAGDERHLGRLASGDEALVKGLEVGGAAGGRQRGHGERAAHLGAAAPAAATPVPGAAVVFERGHPDQGGDLLAGAGAQFGHVGQQGGGGRGADARDALEPGGARAPGVRVMARAAGVVGLAGLKGRTGGLMAAGGNEGSAANVWAAGVECGAGKARGNGGGGGVPVARFEVVGLASVAMWKQQAVS